MLRFPRFLFPAFALLVIGCAQSTTATLLDDGAVSVDGASDSSTDAQGMDAARDASGAHDGSTGGSEAGADAMVDAAIADSATPVASLLIVGTGKLIGVEVISAGVLVITSDEVRLLARDGRLISRYVSPRPITAFAVDGSFIGIADGAAVVALDLPALAPQTSTWLVETCAFAVILSGHRFVCGPINDWERVFYTFDLSAGQLIDQAPPITFQGTPMWAVPGMNAFVTVSQRVSPTNFYLFRLDGNGRVLPAGKSPYHGDFAMSRIFAFLGSPATHLVTENGHFLSIDGSCGASGQPACFMRDGEIGVLRSGESFASIDADDTGAQLYGIVTSRQGYWEPSCDGTNCTLVHVNAGTRTTEESRPFTRHVEYFDSIRFDALVDRVLVASGTSCDHNELPCAGYRIEYASF